MRRVGLALAGTLGPRLFKLLGKSWKVIRVGEEYWDQATVDGKKPVFVCWHQDIPAGAALHGHRDLTVMISRHDDGEIITRVIEGLGYKTSRGSSFDGGSAALRGMLRQAKEKQGFVLTPDGPRGPAFSIAPGALSLAALTGRPILATGFAARKQWRAGSWDRMIFPKPWTRVTVCYAPPLEVPRQVLKDEALLDTFRGRLKERFMVAEQGAAEALKMKPA